MEKAIKLAIEGGYESFLAKAIVKGDLAGAYIDSILLDPLFWQSLGKSLGWGEKACIDHGFSGYFDEYHNDCGSCMGKVYKGWVYIWHKFILHLAYGKDADSFFKDLLANH